MVGENRPRAGECVPRRAVAGPLLAYHRAGLACTVPRVWPYSVCRLAGLAGRVETVSGPILTAAPIYRLMPAAQTTLTVSPCPLKRAF